MIDARGQMVVPGFIDSHVHFIDGGFALSSVQLRDARTQGEFISRIRDYARTLPKGAWITNGDWDHMNWGGELPRGTGSTRSRRTIRCGSTGSTATCISPIPLALTAAGLSRSVRDVPGGEIVRDASGELTGVFKDNAMDLVQRADAAPPAAVEDRALDAAMDVRGVVWRDQCAQRGVAGTTWLIFGRGARHAGRQKHAHLCRDAAGDWTRLRDTVAARGRGDDWLRIGGLKGFVDGSLGSHTAAMFDGFTDKPADTGFFVTPAESLVRAHPSAPTRPDCRSWYMPSVIAPSPRSSTFLSGSRRRTGRANAGSVSSMRSTSVRARWRASRSSA